MAERFEIPKKKKRKELEDILPKKVKLRGRS